ncbi:Amino acid transporter family protein [Spironucleus salmonicida]|uniref:Amino acid transporter family protein n=1 Tax=Spironucleus salmonicida TaxID=348837 RepID=V6LCU1_9EUKA|nr:Amino acid transporter family protein [Spironucleus salmonicida]|eukprot:EST42300.1 Amino acid transporter family protein [Spironucleus salmonicida]
MNNNPQQNGQQQMHSNTRKKDKQMQSTSITLISSMMGVSLLSIGFLLNKLGVVLGVFIFVYTVLSLLIFMYYFISGAHYTSSGTYRELAQAVLGKKAGYILDASLYISFLGYLTGYIVVAAKNIDMFLKSFNVNFNIMYVKLIIAVCVIFPLSCIKSLKQLSKVASVAGLVIFVSGFSFIVYFFVFLKSKSFCGNQYKLEFFPSTATTPVYQQILNFFMYIPGLQGYFTVHTLIPNMLNELQGPPIIRKKIVWIAEVIALCVSLTFYLVTGLMTSAMFNSNIKDNIFVAFAGCNQTYMNVLAFVYAFSIMIAYPLALYPLKVAFASYFPNLNEKKKYLVQIGVAVFYIVCTLLLALVLESIVQIFGLFGALAGYFFYFFIPFTIIIKLPAIRRQNISRDLIESNAEQPIDSVSVALMAMTGVDLNMGRARALSNKIFGIDERPYNALETVPVGRSRAVSIIVEGDNVRVRSGSKNQSFGNDLKGNDADNMQDSQPENAPGATEVVNMLEQAVQEIDEGVEIAQRQEFDCKFKEMKDFSILAKCLIVVYGIICVEAVVMNVIDIINSYP